MPPTPPDAGPVRPIAEINREIRALVTAGGAGTDRYRELLEEWSVAIRVDVRPAA